jgi:hypothetical protein
MKLAAVSIALLVCIVHNAGGQRSEQLEAFYQAERKIVRLRPNAIPELPTAVIQELDRRACTIPQEVFSKKPNNVVKGEFAKRGQTDWAVLCSVKGVSRILVFWNGSGQNPAEVAPGEDLGYLQGTGPGQIGYSRGIQPVDRDFIVSHYKAYGGPTPPPIDHQGINNAFIEKASVVWYLHEGKWMTLTGAD